MNGPRARQRTPVTARIHTRSVVDETMHYMPLPKHVMGSFSMRKGRSAINAGSDDFVDPKHPAHNQPDKKLLPWEGATKGDARRSYDEYGNDFGEWAAHLANWSWFVTCTLANQNLSRGFSEPGLGTARACLRELIVRSEARQFICVFELQKRGVPHLHALLGGCPAINGGDAQQYFEGAYGISRWKVYRHGGAAPKYLGKYLQKEVIELYIGLNGPYGMDDFKSFTGGLTKKGTRRFQWDSSLGGTRV